MTIKIIYVIAGVIWVVSQIIKAKNKAAQKSTPQKQPKPQQAFETVDRPRTYPTKTEAESYENESQEEIINEAEGDTETMYALPQKHILASDDAYFNKIENAASVETIQQQDNPVESIDARKAIIYSEIFGKAKWKE